MNKAEIRNAVCDEFASLVIGPRDGEDEFIEGARGVTLRYLTGILFPKGQKRSDLANTNELFSDDETSTEEKPGDEFSGDLDNPLSMANEELPSSVGLSFVIRKSKHFNISCSAARYESINKNGIMGFQRIPLDIETVRSSEIVIEGHVILGKRAAIYLVRRPSHFRKNCDVVTVSLVNIQEQESKSKSDTRNVEKRLYQVNLICETTSSHIEPYESSVASGNNIEEAILSLQYTDRPIYGIGHGASVDWEMLNDGKVRAVQIAYLPKEIVNRPLFDHLQISESDKFTDRGGFDICRLADGRSDRKKIIADFLHLCNYYDRWIEHQSGKAIGDFGEAEDALIKEMETCSSRMRLGVQELAQNDDYWTAFVLANKAMLYQIDQITRLKIIRSEREKSNRPWPIEWQEQVDTRNTEFPSFDDEMKPYWRPFQLAFFLTCFVGLEDTDPAQRKLVDLIWFSTGGGKTEAYLLLASYELIRRRMRYETREQGYGTGIFRVCSVSQYPVSDFSHG